MSNQFLKKNGVIFFVLFLFFSFPIKSNSQVLISLLLGDKLNSGEIEFGLTGGLNHSNLRQLSSSDGMNTFDLGFYFDFRIKRDWYIYTGVLVKEKMGATKLPVYDLGDDDLNGAFENGSVTRSIKYFNVPIAIKYRFKNKIYMNGGFQVGLMHKATDEFINNINDNDLTYDVDIKKSIKRLDAGLTAGLGYKFKKGHKMNVGLRYYYGLVDVLKSDLEKGLNSTLYVFFEIPIGAGKENKKK